MIRLFMALLFVSLPVQAEEQDEDARRAAYINARFSRSVEAAHEMGYAGARLVVDRSLEVCARSYAALSSRAVWMGFLGVGTAGLLGRQYVDRGHFHAHHRVRQMLARQLDGMSDLDKRVFAGNLAKAEIEWMQAARTAQRSFLRHAVYALDSDGDKYDAELADSLYALHGEALEKEGTSTSPRVPGKNGVSRPAIWHFQDYEKVRADFLYGKIATVERGRVGDAVEPFLYPGYYGSLGWKWYTKNDERWMEFEQMRETALFGAADVDAARLAYVECRYVRSNLDRGPRNSVASDRLVRESRERIRAFTGSSTDPLSPEFESERTEFWTRQLQSGDFAAAKTFGDLIDSGKALLKQTVEGE